MVGREEEARRLKTAVGACVELRNQVEGGSGGCGEELEAARERVRVARRERKTARSRRKREW